MSTCRIRPFALLAPAVLTACQPSADENEANAIDAAENGVTGNAFNAAGDAALSEGVLVPPAPGEPGGLPDDRRPLDEGAMKDPASVAASGATVELFGLALTDGRYDDAYRFWADNGRQSGMSAAEFAQAYRKYSEIHVLVGRPEAGGTQTARVPVQIYGRFRDGGRPFNLYGPMTLARNPKGQKGEPGQLPWLIAASDLRPRGEAKISQAQDSGQSHLIPVGFQGQWAENKAACAKNGDMTRLTIHADTLLFYESQAKVTGVSFGSARDIRVSADYSGEGERWSGTSRLMLSGDGEAMTLDGFRRIRCGA